MWVSIGTSVGQSTVYKLVYSNGYRTDENVGKKGGFPLNSHFYFFALFRKLFSQVNSTTKEISVKFCEGKSKKT